MCGAVLPQWVRNPERIQGELKDMVEPYNSLLLYVVVYPECCSFLYFISSCNYKCEVSVISESCSRDGRRRRRRGYFLEQSSIIKKTCHK
jgi:hypothetical protein